MVCAAEEGETPMRKHRFISSALLLALFLGVLTPQFAQDTPSDPPRQDLERRMHALGLVRQINTAEVTDFLTYGSYASWKTLLEHKSEYLTQWLARNYPQESKLQFGEAPEILPGFTLRLNVHTDGQGYDILLEDAHDKTGYSALSDEPAAIRECKWLQ